MSDEEIDRLLELEKKGSPGPWFVHPKYENICHGDPSDDRDNYPLDNPDDDDFIVAAKTALPWAMNEIKRLRKELEEIRTQKCIHQATKEWLENTTDDY